MALSIFKSPDEEPWDRFCRKMDGALQAASADFSRRHERWLRLGSPVKVSDEGGDVIRAPIEVRGGRREYAIAYLHVKEGDGKVDPRRLEAIAREAAQTAEPYATEPPAKPGEVLLTYP